jgi:RHS repeat-associated protein
MGSKKVMFALVLLKSSNNVIEPLPCTFRQITIMSNWNTTFRSCVFEITAGSVNYIARQQNLKQGVNNYIQNLGIPPGPPTMKGINGDPNNTGIAINPVNDVNTKVPSGWPGQVVFAPAGGPPGAPIQYGDSITNNTVEPGFGYLGNGNVEENLRYFFHSDHLGRTSYITNAKGEITQFVGYMPFGEAFVEQHTDYDSPYKFNGKEMDSETGLSYYGVRYYDPKTARFINCDPIIEKFPYLTPYNYAENEPIAHIDLWGLQGFYVMTIGSGYNDVANNLSKWSGGVIQHISIPLNTGENATKEAVNKLKEASKKDNGIAFLAIIGVHGSPDGYNHKTDKETYVVYGEGGHDRNDLFIDEVEQFGVLNFLEGSIVFNSACNSAVEYDYGYGPKSYSGEMSKVVDATVISATGKSKGTLNDGTYIWNTLPKDSYFEFKDGKNQGKKGQYINIMDL